jgi:hypothetical protein
MQSELSKAVSSDLHSLGMCLIVSIRKHRATRLCQQKETYWFDPNVLISNLKAIVFYQYTVLNKTCLTTFHIKIQKIGIA